MHSPILPLALHALPSGRVAAARSQLRMQDSATPLPLQRCLDSPPDKITRGEWLSALRSVAQSSEEGGFRIGTRLNVLTCMYRLFRCALLGRAGLDCWPCCRQWPGFGPARVSEQAHCMLQQLGYRVHGGFCLVDSHCPDQLPVSWLAMVWAFASRAMQGCTYS